MAKVRTIRAEPSVMEEVNRWCEKFPRIKELMNGSMWRLSREPEKGYEFANGTDGFIYKIERPDESFPYITVRYKFTDEEVIILDIKLIPLL
jgi:hypothetical protein